MSTEKIIIGNSRPAKAKLEVIDDVVLNAGAQPILLEAFDDAAFIEAVSLAAQLWAMVKHYVHLDEHVLIIYPGNGGWLVQRMLEEFIGTKPKPFLGVDISRISCSCHLNTDQSYSHIVVLDDVIETGGTAKKIREQIGTVKCPVTLASLIWYDRYHETKITENYLQYYDNVLIPLRIQANGAKPTPDIRSLSTLARKCENPQNHIYSPARETFIQLMKGCLERHPWLHELGVSLGYRIEIKIETSPP